MALKNLLGKLARPTRRIVLELDLARGVLETFPRNPLQMLQVVGATSMGSLRETLHDAATDPRVAGLIVHVADCGQPLQVLDEIGEVLHEFAQAKPTAAWGESFGELGNALGLYKLATACQRVFVQPTGELCIGGLEVQITLLKGMLDKVGIDPQFGQRHEYKTAADQFAADEVSEANRAMVTRIAQSIVDDAVATIATRRGLDSQQVWDAVNSSPLTADQALQAGLVDQVAYRDQVYATLLQEWEAEPDQLLFVSRHQGRSQGIRRLCNRGRAKVAVISLRGGIVTGRGGRSPLGGETVGSDLVDEHFRAVLRDDDIKAVLFDVDSPGGSAVASDFIRRSVVRVRESGRPVVARMGQVAGSGGYYVSMPCDEIVALPTTLTGSIGVVAGKFVTRRLHELLGITREPVRIGAVAGMMSPATEFTTEDWERLNRELDRIYDTFVGLAAEDRGMSVEEMETLAKGRVWTGADAKERGLVDHLGGWNLAWRRACALADLDPDQATAERIGTGSLLEKVIPARSSEHRAGSTRTIWPGIEQSWLGLATHVGLHVEGALALPWRFHLR
ncbi:signal peptide peptidase SppA [Arachnia propionica]|uniref:Signal peptide peptidase SppA n=1 Tax=Arachnia propionica TaxID=1750 RepID=A0A3P1T8M0_9ACTN|nr:signal peptide peptidase SppA [Arachnia propionica]RRD05792.1 signal peptide peptidase SppA [Arachnia propionica]